MTWLSDSIIQFIESDISIHLASTFRGQASLVRAAGCAVDHTNQLVTLLVDQRQAQPVLLAIENQCPVAVVFSQPDNHKTVQLKAEQAVILPVDERDFALLARYNKRFAERLEHFDIPHAYSQTLCDVPRQHLAKVGFTPLNAFNQTPGKSAGRSMEMDGGVP